MTGYTKYFENDSKSMSFSLKMRNYGKSMIKFGMKLKISWKLNFIASLFMNINT